MNTSNPEYIARIKEIQETQGESTRSEERSATTTRRQLDKALIRVDQYRAILRLASAEIKRRNRNIIALTTFAYEASLVSDLASLLKLALVQAIQTTSAPVGAVVLVDVETNELKLAFHQGLTEKLTDILIGNNLGNGATALMPHLVAGNGALLEYDTTDDPTERMLLESAEVSSLASLPIRIGTKSMGALVVGFRDKRSFKSADLTFLMAIGQETAIAMDNFQLRERLWRTAEGLLKHETDGRLALQQASEIKLNLNLNVPLDLGDIKVPPIVEAAESDLEQLLKTMVKSDGQIQQQNLDLQILIAFSETMNRSLNLTEVLQNGVEQTKSILGTDAAWVYLVDEKQTLKMEAHIGLSKDYVHGMRRLEAEDSIENEAITQNKPCFITSISAHPHKIWVDKEDLRAIAVVPIICPEMNKQGQPTGWHKMGVLVTGKRGTESHKWGSRETGLLISIANQLALAIDNAQLYASVQDNEKSLRGSNEILREINDMVIQKNATFEKFVHRDLKPAISQASQSLQYLLTKNSDTLNKSQKQHLLTLQQIMERLDQLSQQVL